MGRMAAELRRRRGRGIAALAACALCWALSGPAGAQEAPTADAAPDEPATIPDVTALDDLLAALEKADAGLERLSAKIEYTRLFAVLGDRQVRRGVLLFQADDPDAAPPRRRFEVDFEDFLIGRRLERQRQEYVFDGRHLVERLPDLSPPMFQKWEVAGEGSRFDPLRLGEGPLPIPIGQRPADILERFNAEMLPAAEGLAPPPDAEPEEIDLVRVLLETVTAGEGTHQLRLVPRRPPEEEGDFAEVRLWYSKRTLLPRAAMATHVSGDVSVVRLAGVRTNVEAAIPPGAFNTRAPETGWDVVIQPWRGPK
jgi:hypothetical protein